MRLSSISTMKIMKLESTMSYLEDAALKTQKSLAFLDFEQSFILSAALSTSMVLCSHRRDDGWRSGDGQCLLLQLSLPLYFLGGVYRETVQGLVDMKVMFQLFEEKSEIKDTDDAKPLLDLKGGTIRFENVHFSYVPERKILDGTSCVVPAGKSVAIVGRSGSRN